jgi:16S rRNA (cytosine967-C5)-methyltransferase
VKPFKAKQKLLRKSARISPREAAFCALLAAMRSEAFLQDSLAAWRESERPSKVDEALAYHIAYGAMRMAKPLDCYASSLSDNPRRFKIKELAILRCALYQCVYLEKVPLYAIVDEMVSLAKKYCHTSFASFLNAILRKTEKFPLSLPQDDSLPSLSLRYSHAEWFIEQLITAYGLDSAKDILESSNRAFPTTARWRGKLESRPQEFTYLSENIAIIPPSEVEKIGKSSDWYIQNIAPAALMSYLAEQDKNFSPGTILDLCAAPGGKFLLAHDLYTQAELFANDVSSEKLARLQENCQKYGLAALLSCCRGEEYPKDKQFDLIILDVPCSNSGVLHKRPEARWRLSQETLAEHIAMQKQLIANALDLLNPAGQIWYLTCSILPAENELLTDALCQELSLKKIAEKTILPNSSGYDGGYGCLLKKKKTISNAD